MKKPIPSPRIFALIVLLIAMLSLSLYCYGDDIAFIRSNEHGSAEQEEMQEAANFYGLTLRVATAGSGANDSWIRTLVDQKSTVGVVISAYALSTVSVDSLLRILAHRAGSDVPLLILGIRSDLGAVPADPGANGEISRCKQHEASSDLHYMFGRVAGVTEQLAGVDIPRPAKRASYFALDEDQTAQWIESIRDGKHEVPIFVESVIGRQVMFLACAAGETGDRIEKDDIVSAFLRVAPAMMFAKYCAGERGWHALHHYANFTIDDPWLREPYGYVNYRQLLSEMEKHNFHTTIAFIPWNYDRSRPEVVSLFQHHPDRFSIAIHGDNHDHKEFTDYRTKSLAVQVRGLRQALARMERFQMLTGIPYDKVMIFPHSIAPEQTLGALKTYNYLATVNSSNVPQNAISPVDLPEVLRPVTLSFAGFPSILRYSAEAQVAEAYIAVNQFLGNSLLFYDHSDFFSKGIGAFDKVADDVNRLEPATEWRSLGEIVRHLYVVKLRNDSNYDVLAFSNNICLEDTAGRNVIYYIQKLETGGQRIDSVTVDGRVHPYVLENHQMSLAVAVPLGGTRCVAIQYANDLRAGAIDASHDSVVAYLLRMGSDFRDIYLAKSYFGLAIIRFYNRRQLKPVEVAGVMLALLALLSCASWRVGVSVKRRSDSNQNRPCSLPN